MLRKKLLSSILLFALIAVIPVSSFAQGDSEESKVIAWNSSKEEFENLNVLGLASLQIRKSFMKGVSFHRMLDSHLAIGLTYLSGAGELEGEDGGDLSNDQYYQKSLSHRSTWRSVFLQYYFSENGHRKSGFYSRFAYAFFDGRFSYDTNRYGPDNGFIVIGDGKNLLESKTSQLDFKTSFFQAAIGYQLSLKAYNSLFDRVNVGIDYALAPVRRGQEGILNGINDTKNVSSEDYVRDSLQLTVAIPF